MAQSICRSVGRVRIRNADTSISQQEGTHSTPSGWKPRALVFSRAISFIPGGFFVGRDEAPLRRRLISISIVISTYTLTLTLILILCCRRCPGESDGLERGEANGPFGRDRHPSPVRNY